MSRLHRMLQLYGDTVMGEVLPAWGTARRYGCTNLVPEPSLPNAASVVLVLTPATAVIASSSYYVRQVNAVIRVKLADTLFSLCVCVCVREHSYLDANISKAV